MSYNPKQVNLLIITITFCLISLINITLLTESKTRRSADELVKINNSDLTPAQICENKGGIPIMNNYNSTIMDSCQLNK